MVGVSIYENIFLYDISPTTFINQSKYIKKGMSKEEVSKIMSLYTHKYEENHEACYTLKPTKVLIDPRSFYILIRFDENGKVTAVETGDT